VVRRLEAAASEEVAHRVDRERDVVQKEDAHQAAPQQGGEGRGDRAAERVPGGGRDRQAESDEQRERAADQHHPAVLQQVARVALVIGGVAAREEPADVRVP
jgi:hypothetical protein